MAEVLDQASLGDVLENHVGDEGHVCGKEVSSHGQTPRGMIKTESSRV